MEGDVVASGNLLLATALMFSAFLAGDLRGFYRVSKTVRLRELLALALN
jgi:hypothetical protein